MHKWAGVTIIALLASGCAEMHSLGRTGIGAAGGAAAGGLIASQVSSHPAAIAGGTILGLLLGGGTGHVLDQRAEAARERAGRYAADTAERAMISQRAEAWQQDAHNYGSVVPGAIVMHQGRTCRRATITSVIEGKVHTAHVCIRPGVERGSYVVESMP